MRSFFNTIGDLLETALTVNSTTKPDIAYTAVLTNSPPTGFYKPASAHVLSISQTCNDILSRANAINTTLEKMSSSIVLSIDQTLTILKKEYTQTKTMLLLNEKINNTRNGLKENQTHHSIELFDMEFPEHLENIKAHLNKIFHTLLSEERQQLKSSILRFKEEFYMLLEDPAPHYAPIHLAKP